MICVMYDAQLGERKWVLDGPQFRHKVGTAGAAGDPQRQLHLQVTVAGAGGLGGCRILLAA
jgi:hypothetical protein